MSCGLTELKTKRSKIYISHLFLLTDTARGDCPEEFYKIDNQCFYISKDKVSWIEARKHCEMKQSALLALESEAKAIRLSNLVETISQRHFNEFWTSGNDIDVEGSWRWAGQEEGGRSQVPSFGWSEESFRSIEENCLVWVVEVVGRGRVSDGWHPASCCNMHQYVCSSPLLPLS